MINYQQIKKLVKIAEMAKSYGNYGLPDLCFSLLYCEHRRGNARITLFLEREDNEEYYQLLVIGLRHRALKKCTRPKWVITTILPNINISKEEKSSLPTIQEVEHDRQYSKELSKKYIFD